MWTEYKKEIIAQEKQGKKDFLKTFYQKNKLGSAVSTAKDLNSNGDVKLDISFESNSSIRDQSISIVLDSDEEPLPQPQPKENKKVIYNYYDTRSVFGEYNFLEVAKPFTCKIFFLLQNAKNKDKDKVLKEDRQETATKDKEVSANDPNADIDKNEETKIEMEESILPIWLTRYLQFRFNLLDRTGI